VKVDQTEGMVSTLSFRGWESLGLEKVTPDEANLKMSRSG